MAKEDPVKVINKKLVFPPSLTYVRVEGRKLIIDKKPCRGEYREGVTNAARYDRQSHSR